MAAEALVLSPETPYPLQGGGALRTASLLNYLAQRYTVDLIVFRNRADQDPVRALPAGLVRHTQVIDLPFHRKDLLARAARNGWRLLRGVPPLIDRFRGYEDQFRLSRRYQIAVIEHFWCAEYQPLLAAASDRVVLDLHNVESALHASCARAERGFVSLAHRRFAHESRKLEAKWLPRFDAILTASPADACRVSAVAPGTSVRIYPNAIPLTPVPTRLEEDGVIAFSGNLEYHPNQTAVRFFARQVWPRLKERNPRLIWRLIGMNPEAILNEINGLRGVETTGPVEDAVSELAAASVVVAPLLSGSGTRLKIIEAWAACRAVVATPLGAEGLGSTDGENIVLAEGPESFIESIQRLLFAPETRRKIGSAGRDLYERTLCWDRAWQDLDLMSQR